MKHFIYDYETLSQHQLTAPVVAIAMFVFDDTKFYTPEELLRPGRIAFYKFDVKEQVLKFGRKIETECLKWWEENVSKETREWLLSPKKDDYSVSKLPDLMLEYISEFGFIDRVWTRNNTFDPIITQYLFAQFGRKPPYPWWDIRDTKTMIETALRGTGAKDDFMPYPFEFSKHDPVHDIAADVLRLQFCFRALDGLPTDDDIPF